MRYVFLMALVMQAFGATATATATEVEAEAEVVKAANHKAKPAKAQAQRAPASVPSAVATLQGKDEVDSLLGEMQSALEQSDNAMPMDSAPE